MNYYIIMMARLKTYITILFFVFFYIINAYAQNIPQSQQHITLSFAPLVKQTASAVVNIYTQRIVETRRPRLFDDPFFKRFFNLPNMPQSRRRQIQNALGSGVIVRDNGIIVTNSHVVEGSDSITVILNDKRQYDADIMLADPQSDIAILKLRDVKSSLPYLPFGNSDNIEVGDLVLAIGNPFGLGQTVTNGIISALARSNINISDFQSFIQTDAAINPGNSGGALINIKGDLIGINTAIFSRTGTSAGIGFAIPSNFVNAVIDSVLEFGEVRRLWLGIDSEALDYDVSQALNLKRVSGLLISDIHPLSPLQDYDVHIGDILLSYNNFPLEEPSQLEYRLAMTKFNHSARLKFFSKGKEKDITVTPIFPPEIPKRDLWLNDIGNNPLLGAQYMNISPRVIQEYQLMHHKSGVIVESVSRRSAAKYIGIETGDIIDKINNIDITSVAVMRDYLNGYTGEAWLIEILRGGRRLLFRYR